jgi:hypothetical protein
MTRLPWLAAAAAVLGGALGSAAVEWTVRVKLAEVKSAPLPYSRPEAEWALGEEFEGEADGDWVKVKEKGKSGWVHRSAVGTEEELLKDPFLTLRISGTFYPEDVQTQDPEARAWTMNPIVRSTGPAPRSWQLEEFRQAGGLGGGK